MRRAKIFDTVKTAILAVLSIFIIYPFLWLIANSLKDRRDFMVNSLSLIPEKIMWDNYLNAWKAGGIALCFKNTLVITAMSLAIILVACYLASYAFARIRFTGRKMLLITFISTMMLPVQVIVIPLYKMEANLHLTNTLLGLILPYAAGSLPFCIYVLTTFLKTIPFEIEEAGFIDGCSRIQLITRILLPLSKPGLATIIIFAFMNIWNEFTLALIFIQDPKFRTLTLGMLNFQRQWGTTDYTWMFAGLVIISIPVVLVYVIFQKQFISGLTAGSVKA